MDTARVRFYVRPDAWDAWLNLPPPADALNVAWKELKDERLVAAYVLETVCAAARAKAAVADASAGQQTKSYEVVGEWKEEYFAPAESTDTALAADWCARAARLRALVSGETRRVLKRPSVVVLPEQVEP